METFNFDQETNGFLSLFNGNGGPITPMASIGLAATSTQVYNFSLKEWKDLFDTLCESHRITFREFLNGIYKFRNTDFTTEQAQQLYSEHTKHMEQQRKIEDHRAEVIRTHRAEFENACDDIYYGYGFKTFYPNYSGDLSEADAKIVWDAAFNKMSKD